MPLLLLLFRSVPLWGTTPLSGLTGGVLGLTAYSDVLQRGQASVVVPLPFTDPPVTVILSVLVLGEPLTAAKALGAALIVGGVMLLA